MLFRVFRETLFDRIHFLFQNEHPDYYLVEVTSKNPRFGAKSKVTINKADNIYLTTFLSKDLEKLFPKIIGRPGETWMLDIKPVDGGYVIRRLSNGLHDNSK